MKTFKKKNRLVKKLAPPPPSPPELPITYLDNKDRYQSETGWEEAMHTHL
jgi:hypothetical protein